MYITAFPNEQVGYGSMLAVVLAFFGIVLSLDASALHRLH